MKGLTNYYSDCKVRVAWTFGGITNQVYVEIFGKVIEATSYKHPYINLSHEDAERLRNLLNDFLSVK